MFRTLSQVAVLATVAATAASGQEPVKYESYELDNGLTVNLVQDHSTPIVTVDVWYHVGSRNERVGRSGFAHLFEHMMFQGSKNVPKGQHMELVQSAGGSMNGTTNDDRTNYFETLPANRLNLGLWLEADRMRSLAITEDNFENQRETVKEERRLRIDNQPYAKAFIEGLTLLYDSTTCFPYAHTVIGSMDDLNSAKVPDVQGFFDLYYVPNNATLTLVGDFDTGEAKRLIQQYFGDIPRADTPEPLACDVQYSPGVKRVEWEDQLANLPALFIAFRVPPAADNETRILDLLNSILSDGESSRLNRTLVRERKSALGTFAFMNPRLGPGYYAIAAIANQGIPADSLEVQLREQISKIVEDGVSDVELEKAKNIFKANNIYGRQTTMQVAERVQRFGYFYDSVDEMNEDLARYMAITRDDIKRVAEKYLQLDNALILTIVPKKQTTTPVP